MWNRPLVVLLIFIVNLLRKNSCGFSLKIISLNAYNIEYVLGDTPIDNIRKPGISTVIKNLCTLPNVSRYNTAGWDLEDPKKNVLNDDGKFPFVIPLQILMDCFEKLLSNLSPNPLC